MLEQLEIEFKYDASKIKLNDFIKFCQQKNPISYKIMFGYDSFYKSASSSSSFYRHRISNYDNQLTYKRKTVDGNSFVRKEINIDMKRKITEPVIADYCKELGYEFNMSLFKSSFVFEYETYTLVYYICYDTNMNELGRFIEIEMSEDYKWKNKEEAWGQLIVLEKLAKPLGLTTSARIKKSLFEMYGNHD